MRLPSEPNLEHLRGQAKRLLRAFRDQPVGPGEGELGDPRERATPQLRAAAAGGDAPAELARDLVRRYHPQPPERFTLADAQLVIARAYGFASWPKLVAHIEVVERYSRNPHRRPVDEGSPADRFLTLACLTYGADDPARPRAAQELLDVAGESIHTAAAAGDPEAARPHLAQANVQGGPHRWEPILYLTYSRVAGDGSVELARMLLDAGADPSAGFLWEGLPSPFTALTGALGRGEGDPPPHAHALELARLLLEAGADANDAQAIYNHSWTPGDEWLELLYEFGLGAGDGGVWRRRLGDALPTPPELVQDLLLWSLVHGRRERVPLILAHPVDVNGHGTGHPIVRGRTALEWAIRDGEPEIAGALRRAGAREPELTAGERLGAALMAGDPVAPGAARPDPDLIVRAAELQKPDAIERLVAHGVDVNHRHRSTALHEAAMRDDRELVDLLLRLGADPTIEDADYHADAAGWAEHFGHTELAGRLRGLTP